MRAPHLTIGIRFAACATLVSAVILGGLAPAASAAHACRVRNLTTDALESDLQTAIDDASADDILRVKGTCDGNISVSKDLVIRGAANSGATIKGDGTDSAVWVQSGVTTTLRFFKITGGVGPSGLEQGIFPGGGISNLGMLKLRDSTVTDNSSNFRGGGIANDGSLLVKYSTISGNSSSTGGGLQNSNSGTIDVRHSEISGNGAGTGAGIDAGDGTVDVDASTISGNIASGNGGGISINIAGVTLNDTTVTGNTANNGGGVYNSAGSLTLTGSSSVTGNNPNNCVNVSC